MSRFLAAYRTFVEKTTDTPHEFIEAGGLACLSTIAMGRRWISRGSEIRPNLFMMLVAGSSRDRKSVSIRAAANMIGDVETDRMGPEDFTAEALVKHMALPQKADAPHRPIQTICIREFGNYLVQAQSYSATSNSMLCQLYDGDSFEKIRASNPKPLYIDKPRLTIFAACAFGMFERYANAKDWATGFYARFLFVPGMSKRPRFDIEPPAAPLEADIARAALTDLRRELVESSGAMAVHPEVEAVFRSFLKGFGEESVDQAEQAARERLYNTTWKLALLYQLDINPAHPVGVEAMMLATRFAWTCWQGFQQVYRTTAGDDYSRALRKVWAFVSAAGEAGVGRSEILRKFHLDAAKLKSIIDALVTNGVITVGDETVEGGRGTASRRMRCFIRIAYGDEVVV